MGSALVRINNLTLKLRARKLAPDSLVILVPSCLQNSRCARKVTVDVANCRRCGGCAVGEILQVGDDYGVRVACATGGRLALSMVKTCGIRAVVAVACEKELRAGIMGSFPKPVLAICNERPHGPCRDTVVDVAAVRKAVERFAGGRKAPRQKARAARSKV